MIASSRACSAASLSKSASGSRVGRVHLVEALLGAEHLAQALLDRLAHRLRRVELRLLRQEADRAGPASAMASPSILLVDARHDPQQGRLARAVQAQHADLGAREERERDVLEDLALGRDDLAHAVHRVNVLRHGRAFGGYAEKRDYRRYGTGLLQPRARPARSAEGRAQAALVVARGSPQSGEVVPVRL